MSTQEYYVYMMTGRSGVFYTGMTNHWSGASSNIAKEGVRSPQSTGSIAWFYFDSTSDVREAISFEKRLKRWPRPKKIAPIKRSNPRFLDLAETVLGLPPLTSATVGVPVRSGDPDATLRRRSG